MDFAKAFDKVSHRHLFYKLNYYGVNNNALHWIMDFLNRQSQTVVLEGATSDTIPVTSGVPQGYVLGLILFLIYINDFPENLTFCTLRLFADDIIIYKEIHSESDARNLHQDLEAAERWEQDWLMCFHPDKCNVLSINLSNLPIISMAILLRKLTQQNTLSPLCNQISNGINISTT